MRALCGVEEKVSSVIEDDAAHSGRAAVAVGRSLDLQTLLQPLPTLLLRALLLGACATTLSAVRAKYSLRLNLISELRAIKAALLNQGNSLDGESLRIHHPED